MTSDSEISTSSVVPELSHKIKCHSSKQLFCRGDICFIEYAELTPTKTEYGCMVLDKTIDQKCNKTIDLIHRECCATTFCNSRLFSYDIYHRQNHRGAISNVSSMNDNDDLFHTRLQIVLNMMMAILLFSLFCAIIIYLWKQRIKGICKHIGQRTIRSRKLQPSLSAPMPINTPKIPLHLNNANIIHLSPCSPTPPVSIEEYSTAPALNLLCANDAKCIDMI